MRLSAIFLLLASSFFASPVVAQTTVSLPRSSPEAEGVSSEAMLKLLDAFESSSHEMHSIMILRHGKVIAEGWWKPFGSEIVHTMYSVSKSFTATAIGFAVAEKRLTVEDKVISFFPADLPDTVSENLKALRIRDLLSMSVGQAREASENWQDGKEPKNWVKAFLEEPVTYQPGTKFKYNSLATYMLSAIVQKITGEKVIDYLRPRLFEPMGIRGIDWETDPKGINTGGWGLRLKTEDMAKFGQCFLDHGKWQGKQLIPASWIDSASSRKIWQDPDAAQSKKDSSDWLQGYCYQMWRGRNNSFRGDGAFGQYIIMIPDADAVAIITSETKDMQGEQNLLWQYLLPAFQKGKLKANPKQQKLLKQKLAALAVKKSGKFANTAIGKLPLPTAREKALSGKTYGFVSPQQGSDSIRFFFNQNGCSIRFYTDTAVHEIPFGKGYWQTTNTTRRGPYLVAKAANNRVGLPPAKVAGRYEWKDDNTLECKLLYYQSPHTETLQYSFTTDGLKQTDSWSFNNNPESTLSAVLVTPRNKAPQLIMRGDDMGFSHSGNLALLKAYKEGIETSIEVIAASPWFPEAVKLLATIPDVEVGLHFAITSEWDNVKWRPLTEAASLRDADGYFYPMLWPNKNYPKRAIQDNAWKLADIEKELRAQIELAKKYIPRLNHISGHMGSLAFTDEVKQMVIRVAAEYKLLAADIAGSGSIALEYFPANLWKKDAAAKAALFLETLDKLEEGKTYLFVEHPGLDNEELRAIHHIGYENVAEDRQGVTDLFTSPVIREAIIRKGIHLVGYLPKQGQFNKR